MLFRMKPALATALAGGVLGVCVLLLVWGTRPLDPFDFEWMVKPFGGDFSFSAIAALAYLRDAWTFPPGVITTLLYPNLTSIAFADSVPLFALPAKVIHSLVGTDFQYFGYWGLLCAVLQGSVSALIIYRACRSISLSLVGSLFLLFSPFFLGRMFSHISMGAQWVVLVPLALIAYRAEPWVARYEVGLWSAIAILSVTVIPYFVPMVLGMAALYFALQAETGVRRAALRFVMTVATAVPGIVFLFWLSGGLLPDMTPGGGNYGAGAFNLAWFLDPGPFTRLWPRLPSAPSGHLSGDSYSFIGTGLAVGGLILVASLPFRRHLGWRFPLWRALAYALFCLVFLGFAVSNVVKFADVTLFSYPLPDRVYALFSSFRSSSRFVWPIWYMLVFAIIAGLTRLPIRKSARLALLGGLFALQAWDSQGFKAPLEHPNLVRAAPPLKSRFWSDLRRAGTHLYIIPFWSAIGQPARGQMFYEAVRADVTTGIFWLGRYPMQAITASDNRKLADLAKGIRDPDDILLIGHAPALAGMTIPNGSEAYLVDDIIVVTDAGLGDAAAGIDPVTVSTMSLTDYAAHLAELAPRSVIVAAGRQTIPPAAMSDATRAALGTIGFAAPEAKDGGFAYLAIAEPGKAPTQVLQSTPIQYSHRAGSAEIRADFPPGVGEPAKVRINGSNVVRTSFGLTLAVYDVASGKVVETAAFTRYGDDRGVVIRRRE